VTLTSISREHKRDIIFAQCYGTVMLRRCVASVCLRGREHQHPGETPMPLMPAAVAAIPDTMLRTVRFVMKDGTKPVVVLVSNAVLESIESATYDHGSYFRRLKRHRKQFERMASEKYDKGYVEVDGTVCIRTMDLPLESAN
jgi:hypothetical protein